ncbi:MAG: protein-glutamate O-methyltransferase CheR [Candidatus Omnitrophica bacterium]|nr:protein-glutamate O-methyltransferase CheR [Candidatus Omnitrophota bacterium]
MHLLTINDKEFHALQNIMYRVSGVRLLPTKKALMVARLRKRLKELGVGSFEEYLELIRKPASGELEVFVNAITTTETFFYRHPEQFYFLMKTIFPFCLERKKNDASPELRVWSAACATGEEPYSLAIACQEFFKPHPKWNIIIYATDINSAVLDFAKEAVYTERSMAGLSSYLKGEYFERLAEDPDHKRCRFRLRKEKIPPVTFLHHNLLNPFPYIGMDIILLRNVMIYYDKPAKQKVTSLVEKNLVPGGYLLISMTETLQDIHTTLRYVQTGSGVYQKG